MEQMEYDGLKNTEKIKSSLKGKRFHKLKTDYLYNIRHEIFNLSIKKQILIFSIFFYTLFILTIIFLKSQKLRIHKIEIADNIYLTAVGNDYLHDITETYKNIHSLAFDRNMTHFTKGANFMSILTKEMDRINFNPSKSKENKLFINKNSIENLSYSNIKRKGLIFDIKEDEKKKFIKENQEKGFNLLFPIFYSLIPNLIDNAYFNGLSLEKIFFVDTQFKEGNCKEDYSTNYFSFPKYKENHKNFDMIDEKIDPHSSCQRGFKGYNFFTEYEKDFNNNKSNKNFFSRKIFNQFQLFENNMKYTNYFSVIMSNKIQNKEDTNNIFSIGFNFVDDLSLKNVNQNGKINHFSIAYLPDNLLTKYNNTMESAKITSFEDLNDYDIVNGGKMVMTIPPFMENLYIYGFKTTKYFKEYRDDIHAIVSTKDLFAYGDESVMLNFRLKKDSKTFNLLGFLYKQLVTFPDNNCAEYKYKMSDFGIDDEYDCFKDLCYFNKCLGTESIYNSTIYENGYIRCKCLPFFCGNYPQRRIKEINEKYKKYQDDGIKNVDDNEELDIIAIHDSFSQLQTSLEYLEGDYFKYLKDNKKNLQCKITYDHKTSLPPEIREKLYKSFYRLDVELSKMPLFTNGKFILSYLINLNDFIYNLYLHFASSIENFNSLILSVYAFLIWLSSVIFFYRFIQKIDNFKKRINRLTEYNILEKIFERSNELEERGRLIREENSATKDFLQKKNENYLEVDELDEIDDIVHTNIDLFVISFNNEIVFHEEDPIFIKYIDTLKKDMMIKTEFDKEGYTKKIINFYFGKNFFDYFIIENLTNEKENKQRYLSDLREKKAILKKFDEDKKYIYKDYSSLLLMEFISTEIDLDTICFNFYYKDILSKKSENTFQNLIDELKDDIPPVCESCDYEKMKKFISFIKENVIFKWQVEEQKRIFNDYYFNGEF